jgi:hypothetical protein
MAELFFVGVVVLVLYFLVRGMATLISGVGGRRFRAYRQLASRYRGRYEHRGFNEPPTVSFSYNGSNVRVGLAPVVPGQNLGPRTRVVARFLRGIPLRLELAPVSRALPPQPPRGTRLVRAGDPEFDRSFNIHSNDPDIARAFLSPPVRGSLMHLGRLVPPGGFLVSVNPERLLVQVDRNLGANVETLTLAVREALVIHDSLLFSVTSQLGEGVQVLDDVVVPAEEVGPPLCKVCGEPILKGPRTVCRTCHVPYHADCWEFIGSCSVFGCGGKTGEPG